MEPDHPLIRKQKTSFLGVTLCAALLLACALPLPSQTAEETSALREWVRNALGQQRVFPQEKAYLHFDNTGYFIGETMRFKAYVVSTDSGRLTRLSHVLYVELLHPGGEVIARRKVCLTDGEGSGDIVLDKVFRPGFYEVRAYTRYMTNWGPSACFSRVFPVFKEPASAGDYTDLSLDMGTARRVEPDVREADSVRRGRVNVRFFPEGGRLVRGLSGRVAFLLTDRSGRPLRSEALLLDARREVLSTVRTDSDGRGVAEVADGGAGAVLCVGRGEGKAMEEFALPAPSDTGCVMRVDAVTDSTRVTVRVETSAPLRGLALCLALQQGGRLCAWPTFVAEEGARTFEFRREQLREGVNQLTLFGPDGRVWADRLFFVHPRGAASDTVRVTPRQSRLAACGKVTLDIEGPAQTSLSLSAADLATLPTGREQDVRSWLLLSSDLRGYIAHPLAYLERDDAEHRAAADRLMMVQGWRKYDWRERSAPLRRKAQFVEDRLCLYGHVRPRRKRQPVAGVDVTAWLYDRSGRSLRLETRTDTLGRYAFTLPDLTGPWALYLLSSLGGKAENYVMALDRHFDLEPRRLGWAELQSRALPRQNLFARSSEFVPVDSSYRIAAQGLVLPDVHIRGHRLMGDPNRPAWKDESYGSEMAGLYYDIDAEAERILDRGEELPTLMEWLRRKNPNFGGEYTNFYSALLSCADTLENLKKTEHNTMGEEDQTHISELPFVGVVDLKYRLLNVGLNYNNRPVLWIVDNSYCCTTCYPDKDYAEPHDEENLPFRERWKRMTPFFLEDPRFSVAQEFPGTLNEVKNVYISQNPSSYRNFVKPNMQRWNASEPVAVFVYTHHVFWSKREKGQRRTAFEGFNEPTLFEMNDYAVMPPLPNDFRRTLFWAPDVRTDAKGHATVEFYNNSTCREMHISVEGITPEGRAVCNSGNAE